MTAFGVLGAAKIAPSALLDPAREQGHRVVAIAARDRARAEAVAASHDIERVLSSYDEVVSDPEVEVVYDPLPNGLHGPWNLRAIAAGKHVLSEKPFASNAAEAAEVLDAAAAAGVVVAEAFHNLYHPLVARLEEIVASGEIGELQSLDVTMVMPPPPPHDLRWDHALAGGGLMDVGCYALSLARVIGRHAGGEPELVTATAVESPEHPGIDAELSGELRFPGGATVTFRCAMNAATRDFSCRLTGSHGAVEAPSFVQIALDDRLLVTTGAGTRTEHLGTRPSYSFQLEAFARHLTDGTPLRWDSSDVLAQARLVDAVYAATGLGPRPRWAQTV